MTDGYDVAALLLSARHWGFGREQNEQNEEKGENKEDKGEGEERGERGEYSSTAQQTERYLKRALGTLPHSHELLHLLGAHIHKLGRVHEALALYRNR